jgi:hypothetical protein
MKQRPLRYWEHLVTLSEQWPMVSLEQCLSSNLTRRTKRIPKPKIPQPPAANLQVTRLPRKRIHVPVYSNNTSIGSEALSRGAHSAGLQAQKSEKKESSQRHLFRSSGAVAATAFDPGKNGGKRRGRSEPGCFPASLGSRRPERKYRCSPG